MKKLNETGQTKEFEAESNMLKQLRHPCIVSYLGLYLASDAKYICTEFMSKNNKFVVVCLVYFEVLEV